MKNFAVFGNATSASLDTAVFALFIIAVILVGLIKGGPKKRESSEDYFLAGRGLPWWIIGVSLIAANISTEQFVGESGAAAGPTGLAIASYEWMAAVALVFVGWFFLPKFLKSGIYTMPQFLEYRFDPVSRTVMSLLMLAVLVCVNITAVIYSGATVSETVLGSSSGLPFEADLTTACWVIGCVAAAYVCAGGLKAAAWADLLQGASLIIGGALITYFAFAMFDSVPAGEIATTSEIAPETIESLKDAGALKKFFALNSDKLTMFLPASDSILPWTALVVGLWIPNFYYWGLNQYIIQRTLGAKSLAEGQKGIMFAAGLKLLTPFIIVIPGIMAFNLFSESQREGALRDASILASNARNYSAVYFDSLEREGKSFSPREAAWFFSSRFDRNRLKKPVVDEKAAAELYNGYLAAKKSGALANTKFEYDAGWAKSNPELKKSVDEWNARVASENPAKAALYGYKYDSAFGLLISRVLPDGFGLRGFVFAALLGAVVSSLAAMLNAASTIFAIDIYKRFVNPEAGDRRMVFVGRVSVLAFAAIGCSVAPMLANPNFGGIFTFIQEFQGYLSPGILAVFLFGLFSSRTPRFAGVAGIVASPVVYGILQFGFGGIAFLNRMAITFGCSLLVMFALTVLKPLDREVAMPVNPNMDLASRPSVRMAGIAVLGATAALYAAFSGIWF